MQNLKHFSHDTPVHCAIVDAIALAFGPRLGVYKLVDLALISKVTCCQKLAPAWISLIFCPTHHGDLLHHVASDAPHQVAEAIAAKVGWDPKGNILVTGGVFAEGLEE